MVTEYEPGWPGLFEDLARPVRAALGGLAAAVEHVGSTAVPGLAAKPVIDLDVVVRSGDDVAPVIERLRALGYEHEGNLGIEGREAFKWPPESPRHHLYVVVEGGRPHRDHIDFRDHLREHPQAAREYGELKRALADRHGDDRKGYTRAKEEFISSLLAAARSPLPRR